MPHRIRLTPLIVVVQPVRPDMSPSTVNLGIAPIPGLQQLRRTGPVIRAASRIKRPGLTDPQRVRDLMEGGPLVHVRPVGSEADVAVEVAVGCLDAGHVLRCDGLGGTGGEPVVARHGRRHGGFDFGVGIGLV